MADDADRAQEDMDRADAEREKPWQRPTPYVFPPGDPGDCELCGRWSGRLIGGACAPCRDKYRLP